MSGRIGIAEVKRLLQDRIEDLCRQLLPGGRREGRLWVSANPITGDEKKRDPALKVALSGDAGAWRDWRGGDRGDVIDLVAYVNRTDRAGALAWGKDWLGLARLDDRQRLKLKERVRERAAAAQRAGEADERKRRERAFQLWCAAAPALAGTPAALYLAGRACPLEAVPNLSRHSFRFAASLEWWKGAEYEEQLGGRRIKVRAGPRFPALVAALRAAGGALTAVHCTYLAQDGERWTKAPVNPAKLMFGTALGAAIRVADGPTGLPPEETREPHPLIVTEGIEDALSVAIAVPEARVWAAGSLAALAAAPVDQPCVSAVVPAVDNDLDNPQAQAALERALEALEATTKPVATMASFIGKDFNDLVRALA